MKSKLYAVKMLFQFRVVGVNGQMKKRRLCEKRIRLIRATSAKDALAQAKSYGKAERHHYKNSDGETVRFEFVGVMELLHLDPECEPDEVWWEMGELLAPSERRDRFIPTDKVLLASTAG